MQNEQLKKVEEFHKQFDIIVNEKIDISKDNINKLRLDLLKEELNELETALNQKDKVETLDALIDIQYILLGTILSLGYKNVFDEAFDRVHNSNMTKACQTEEELRETLKYYLEQKNTLAYSKIKNNKYLVYRSSDNKVLKSINYESVVLNDLID